MPTDNKKISAYVPDVIYNRFIQFQEEHEISMSKAAIEIFAAYFGININPTISNETTSELLSRIDILEKELADLKDSHIKLYEKVDLIFSTSEPLINQPLEVSVDKVINSEVESNLVSEPDKKDDIGQPVDIIIINEPQGGLDSELLNDSKNINSSELLSEVKNEPLFQLVLEPVKTISNLIGSVDDLFHSLPIDTQFGSLKTSALAKRFDLSDAMLHKIKDWDINRQISYTTSKDPDKRPWVFSKSAKLFYPLKISE